jgi:tellurite resistance protein TerC
MVSAGILEWGIFFAAVAIMLVADIVPARGKKGRDPGLRTALFWSVLWIAVALGFGVWLWLRFGSDTALTYLTAYLLEKSLSVDNLFVFALIFSQTGIPPRLQHRALFWGIVGAFVMRGVLIAFGIYLLQRLHWVNYPFAALLLIAAARLLWGEERERKVVESSCAICNSWIARFVPISPVPDGAHFFVRKGGRRLATPLLVALIAIEGADLVFAVDSIPAVLAVTQDPYLVYTSNLFALLGLRSLYFVLGAAIRNLRFLRPGLAVMLILVAVKMLLGNAVQIPPVVSLAVIAGIFGAAVLASRLFPGKAGAAASR